MAVVEKDACSYMYKFATEDIFSLKHFKKGATWIFPDEVYVEFLTDDSIGGADSNNEEKKVSSKFAKCR